MMITVRTKAVGALGTVPLRRWRFYFEPPHRVPLIKKSVLLNSANKYWEKYWRWEGKMDFDWFYLAICCLSTLMYDCQEYFERCCIHNNSNINHHHYHHFHKIIKLLKLLINLHTYLVPPKNSEKDISARCFRPEEEQYSKTRSSEGQSRLFRPGWHLCKTLSSTLSRHSSNLPQLFAKILTICTSGWKKNPATLGLLARKKAQWTSWFICYNYCLVLSA